MSPCNRASFSRASDNCCCLLSSSRLSTVVSPRISNSSASSFCTSPVRSTASRSITWGSDILTITSNRMMAPKPQDTTSRKDILKMSTSRRLRLPICVIHSRDSWPVPRRRHKRTAGINGKFPVSGSGVGITFHRQQDSIDGNTGRQ